MKIGVYIGQNSPESGGGFTFEQSILGCLKNIQSKHEFILFYDEQLKHEFQRSFFQKVLNHLRIKKVQTSNLNRAANKYKIELMWFLTPAYQFVDVPFIYTVWDLQHRLQPYFPEVSVTGALFDNRENYYKNIIPRASYVVTGNDAGKEEIKLFYGVPDFRIKTIEFPTPDVAINFTLRDASLCIANSDTSPGSSGRTVGGKPSVNGIVSKFKSFSLNNKKITMGGEFPVNWLASQPKSFGLNNKKIIDAKSEKKKFVPPFSLRSELGERLEGYLFYPAQFWPHKNHILILLAAKILKEKFNLNFDIVFTGSDKGNLKYIKQKTKELGLENQVHFLGFVEIEELMSLYQNAFALVFPSFFGPNNIPPLEAFALKCPVISSNVSGMKLQLKDAALFFDPKDEKELAEVIKKLFEDKNLRKELIEKGFKTSQSRTSKDYVNEIIKIIDEFESIRRCWSNKDKYIHP